MAGEGAELKLRVSLDLTALRRQLATVGTQLSGQALPLQVRLDRSTIRSELNALQRQLGNKTFRLEVNTNLESEIKNADRLVRALQRVQSAAGGARGASPIGTAQLGRTAGQGGFSAAQIKSLFSAAIQGGLLDERELGKTRAQMVAALGSIGRDSIAGLLNGLSSGDAQLRAAAESLGESLIAALKAALGIASPSKETGKLGKFAAEGFEKGFIAGMIKAERTIARAVSNAAIAGIYEGLTTIGNLAPAFVPLERALAAQIRQSFQRAMRDGVRASMVPGVQGGLLGLLGGGATGAAIGGARALGGAATSGLASLGAGGVLGASRQLGRLAIGDTSGLTSFVQEATAQAMHQAFSTGTLGALIGAAAVGGVAGSSGFVRGAIGSLTKQIIEGIANRILAGVSSIASGDIGPAIGRLAQAIVSALVRDLESRVQSMNISFPSMLPALPPAYRGLPQAGGNAFGALPPAYRGLPGGTLGGALPGTVFAEQKRLVGDILSPSLKEALRGAANAFVDAVRAELNAAVRQVSVRDLGTTAQRALRGGVNAPIAGLLPAAGGTTPIGQMRFNAVSTGAFVGNQPFMRAPSIPTPPGGGGGGGRGGGGGFNFGPNFGRDLLGGLAGRNGAGVIGEIGSEFAQATKQVLLFGTAYKALAAITALPGNIANATANLQSFRNQLEAVTGGGQIMTNSLRLIEDTVSRFNMPIESARQGFVRLYASMAPAGISTETINSIFTGLAASSTTLGMSADQVDRMTYALSQMASKGQITSEELKGQLGDVFPQAVSLFAEAAGFLNDTMDEQAKAKGLSAFLKALEDGALRGEAMQKVLSNVGILLNQDFGATGEKAAASFRGQINALNNALVSFYESFSPIAAGFLGEFVTPIVKSLTSVGEAVKLALSPKAITNNPLASYLRDELFPQLQNIKTAIIAAGQTFGIFAQAIAVVLRPLAQFILGNQTLISGIARGLTILIAYRTAVAALNSLGIIPLIANIIKYNAVFRVFITQTAAGVSGSRAFSAALAQTGMSAGQAVTGIRTLAATIRTALVASAIGVAVVAIGLLIERIMQLQAVAESVRARGQGVSARLGAAARGGGESLRQETANIKAEIASANKMRSLYIKGTKQGLTETELRFIQERGGDISMFSSFGGVQNKAITIAEQRRAREAAALQQRTLLTMQGRLQETLPSAQKNAAVIDRRLRDQSKLNLTGLGADIQGKGTGGGKKAADDASKLAEEIARQAAAASDALFAEQQRLLILQQTNPTAKAIAEYTSQELTIKRELSQALKEAKSDKEKENLLEIAKTKSAANVLELEDKINQARKSALEPIERLLKDQKEQRQVEADIEELLRTGMSPERAKQVAEVRKLIREQLASFDLLQDEAKQAIVAAEARGASADEMERLRKILQGIEEDRKKAEGQGPEAEAGVPETKPKTAADYIGEGMKEASDNLKELMNIGYQVVEAAKAIGNAFGESFKGMITGSMTAQQALANFFQSVGDYFVDMAARMIAEWLTMKAIGLVANLLGGALGGGGSILSATSPTVGAIGQGAGIFAAANGGIAMGGFQAFANGGVVKGPTLGLVGEGRYNEAIVPLPDGRSIPVKLGDGAGNQIISNITVNVSNGQAQSNANGSNSSELGRKLEGAVKQVIVGELRPGGLLAGRR